MSIFFKSGCSGYFCSGRFTRLAFPGRLPSGSTSLSALNVPQEEREGDNKEGRKEKERGQASKQDCECECEQWSGQAGQGEQVKAGQGRERAEEVSH